MFDEIEKLISEVKVTPAEIAEEFVKSDEAEKALKGLIESLKLKKNDIVHTEEKEKDGAKESKEVNEGTENP